MAPADKDLQDLTDRLGLIFHRQDWGICNADAGRVREFIRLCRTAELTPPQQYAMTELVLASMNEALAEGTADDALLGEFKAFLTLNLHGLPQQIRYWASLTSPKEFPLSDLLGQEAMT
jgi:hypothetical protein